jgi:hypothetical protein
MMRRYSQYTSHRMRKRLMRRNRHRRNHPPQKKGILTPSRVLRILIDFNMLFHQSFNSDQVAARDIRRRSSFRGIRSSIPSIRETHRIMMKIDKFDTKVLDRDTHRLTIANIDLAMDTIAKRSQNIKESIKPLCAKYFLAFAGGDDGDGGTKGLCDGSLVSASFIGGGGRYVGFCWSLEERGEGRG